MALQDTRNVIIKYNFFLKINYKLKDLKKAATLYQRVPFSLGIFYLFASVHVRCMPNLFQSITEAGTKQV